MLMYYCMQVAQDPASLLGERMESFWLAETLKYLYLLFADSTDSHYQQQQQPTGRTAESSSSSSIGSSDGSSSGSS